MTDGQTDKVILIYVSREGGGGGRVIILSLQLLLLTEQYVLKQNYVFNVIFEQTSHLGLLN